MNIRHAEKAFITERIANEYPRNYRSFPLFFLSFSSRAQVLGYIAQQTEFHFPSLSLVGEPPLLIPPSHPRPSPSFAQGREEYQFLTGDSVTVRETDAIKVKLTFFTAAFLLNSLPPPALLAYLPVCLPTQPPTYLQKTHPGTERPRLSTPPFSLSLSFLSSPLTPSFRNEITAVVPFRRPVLSRVALRVLACAGSTHGDATRHAAPCRAVPRRHMRRDFSENCSFPLERKRDREKERARMTSGPDPFEGTTSMMLAFDDAPFDEVPATEPQRGAVHSTRLGAASHRFLPRRDAAAFPRSVPVYVLTRTHPCTYQPGVIQYCIPR